MGANIPRLTRAQVRGLKRKIALRNRLTMKALAFHYGVGRKALFEYYTGQTLPLEDWLAWRNGREYCPAVGRRLGKA